MISQTNSSVVNVAYQSKSTDSKEAKQSATVANQGDTSKLEQLKESVDSGEYKVNIQTLSEKVADSLL